MKDLQRFVWRGSLGGAIVPSLSLAYYLVVLYGTPLFWVALITSLTIAIPGALVSVGLWSYARFVGPLGILLRVTIGMAITSTILALACLGSLESMFNSPQYFRRLIFSAGYYLAVGGFAGWMCPATTIFRKESETTYWERVRDYEAAQAEHEFWKATRFGNSPGEKH